MAILTHRLEYRIAVIAAFALFMAQLGALAHAYSHTPAASTATPLAKTSIHELCDDCLNFAPLLAAAGTPDLPSPELPHGIDGAPRSTVAAFVQHKTLLAFRSRAPPAAR